ncbi:MAG: transglycosylase SLT domain-containing protein [Burkholderiales bacterium]|nr:transglycosylase SLT domain-containing protein [Burkholderiales bacterium]
MRTKLLLSILAYYGFTSACNADVMAEQFQQTNQMQIRSQSNLWQRMRDGFKLDHTETKEVKFWEKKYSSPKYFNIIMQNAAPYLYFVVTEMERRGIPLELALVPIVESTYNPNAISPSAISTGMWQFLNGSGKRFGMTINSDLDERKDIIKSTRGAIAYLQYLNDLFGSWELAIAAYNWGEGNINSAVLKANSKNFYDLDVRDVTKQYVPKVIALANIIENPSKFGIKLTDLQNQPYFAIAYPPDSTTVNNFISQAGIDTNLNKKLNPQYNSLSYNVSNQQRLLVPIANQLTYLASIGQSDKFQSQKLQFAPQIQQASVPINTPPQQNIDNTVNNDDPIAMLANNSASKIQASPQPVNTSPQISPSKLDINDLLSSNQASTNYTVAIGDTLYSISKKFAVSIDQLRSDNNIGDNGIQVNQTLTIRTNG